MVSERVTNRMMLLRSVEPGSKGESKDRKGRDGKKKGERRDR